MDWADLFSVPPWPESSPSRREVKPMSFLETLSYDAPDSYESTLTSILDTDFPLPSSPSRRGVHSPSQRRGVLSPSRRGVLSPSQRGVLSPSRRGVLSRSGSGRSVFGESRSVFGDSRSVFGDNTSVFTDSTNVFTDSTNVFTDSTNILANATLYADAAGSPGDGVQPFLSGLRYAPTGSGLRYAPSDRTDSMSDGDLTSAPSDLPYAPNGLRYAPSGLRYAPSDLTSAASDRTDSVSEGEPYDALDARSLSCAPEARSLPCAPEARSLPCALGARSLPCAPEAEHAGEEEAFTAALEAHAPKEQGRADEEQGRAAGEEPQIADEDEQANEGRSFTEIVFPLMPGLLLPEPSFAFVHPSPSIVPPSPSILPPSPRIDVPAPSILPPYPSVDAPAPSILPLSPTLLPPYPSVDVPERTQSPASVLASLARFYGCFPDAANSAPLDPSYHAAGDSSCHAPLDAPCPANGNQLSLAPCDSSYPAPCDLSYPAAGDEAYPAACDQHYPAACDQPTRNEGVATYQDTAVHHDAASDVEYYRGARDGDAREGGAREGGARDGDDTGGAQPISPRATSTATDPQNTQTKPRRKARKSKGTERTSSDDAIEQTAPRATAPHAPASAPASQSAAPASHSASPASHSAARASHSGSPASHSTVPVSHPAARASHSAAHASHSAAHDDSPEYAEVTAQRRQAKRARKARGTNGRAVIDSAVNAAVAIAASVPDFAPAPRSAARVQPVAARGQTAVNASAHERAAPIVRAQEPASDTGMTAAPMASRVPNALPPAHVFPAAPIPAVAPSAAAYAPQAALTSASTGATVSSRPLAPPAPTSSGSRTSAMLWQALMKGELNSEEMQAYLRPDVKKLPILEGARADVLRSVALSEGVPVAPPSFGSLGMGASSDSMGHPAGSSSSTSPRGMKRKHGHDSQPEDPNWTRCEWTHFDAKNKPMGPCAHFYNKKSDRGTLRENVRDHMRMMEPNRCDGIYCQWSHDCKRHDQYFADLYAVVDHIVDIILGTEMRVRR